MVLLSNCIVWCYEGKVRWGPVRWCLLLLWYGVISFGKVAWRLGGVGSNIVIFCKGEVILSKVRFRKGYNTV